MTINPNRSIATAVTTLMLIRLVINMTRRMTYPFVSAIARQLGVTPAAVQSVIALQSATGVASPLFGPLAERYGRKRMIAFSIMLIICAATIFIMMPQYALFAAAMVAFGIAKIIADTAIYAYVGDRVTYQRRGLALGIIEISWAGSLIIIAPVAGFLLAGSSAPPQTQIFLDAIHYDPIPSLLADSSGIQQVFVLFAILSIFSIVALSRLIPADKPHRDALQDNPALNPLTAWHVIRESPAAIASLIYSLCIAAANEVFFINYALWMENSFGLVIAALGIITTIVAVAEIGGEVTIIGLADRLGKKRLALFGASIAALSYVVVPALTTDLTGALIGLFIMFITVEIGIVASLPLFTEVLPHARAVMMSGVAGFASLGRLIGGLIGSALFAWLGDFVLIGGIATLIGLIGCVALWRFVADS